MSYVSFKFRRGLHVVSAVAIASAAMLPAGIAQAGVTYTITGMNASVQNPSGPSFLTYDAAGNLFFSDDAANQIRKRSRDGQIVTVAGMGTAGYTGDGGPALAAALYAPMGLAFDGLGNLYFSDMFNNVIRKIDAQGIISTIAGTGVSGYAGDGGLATAAKLNQPLSVATDPAGNVYVADTGNNVIRKIDTRGLISTFAGTGQAGYAGDGQLATTALLNSPWGIAFNVVTGDLHIADYNNAVVRKVDTHGIITTFAGNGLFKHAGDGGPAISASLISPAGITVDVAGNVYVSDMIGGVVRRIGVAGKITTPAGHYRIDNSIAIHYAAIGDGGPADLAIFSYPLGVAVDANGNLYIADTWDGRIRQSLEGTASFNVNVSGSLHAIDISIDIEPATGLAGQPGQAFVVAAATSGENYILGPNGWSVLNLAQPVAYATGSLRTISAQVVSGFDLYSMKEPTLYIGYGRGGTTIGAWNDMLTNLTFQAVNINKIIPYSMLSNPPF